MNRQETFKEVEKLETLFLLMGYKVRIAPSSIRKGWFYVFLGKEADALEKVKSVLNLKVFRDTKLDVLYFRVKKAG